MLPGGQVPISALRFARTSHVTTSLRQAGLTRLPLHLRIKARLERVLDDAVVVV